MCSGEKLIEAFASVNESYKFGFTKLKQEQLNVMCQVLQGRDVFCALPTGYGKSACFYLPPLLLDERKGGHHTSLIITPLVAIMEDHAQYLRSHGVKVHLLQIGANCGNVFPQPAGSQREQKAIPKDNLIENFDEDLLLAACEDWEEDVPSHPANESRNTGNARSANGDENIQGAANWQPVQQSIPRATQLEDLPGFDVSAGKIWIYPTNYPVRDYQYNIVQQALFKNTMVSLPTGLGKTFVAAVVMYNFYRWYPEGRVVFMAPTKPLVAQQIEACHNVMGIDQSDMAEMTGSMPPVERKKAWYKCRVFFLTPQVLMNDLSRRACPTQLVKCLVVDEAHKALGNHAYCQVVRELSKYSAEFRVLALSATPGSDLKAIQQVLTNLLISHIEIRSEDSIDIQRYVHQRKVEKVVVPLDDELTSVRDRYLRILSVYVGRLSRCGVLYNKDPSSLSKFQILQSRDAFRQDPPPQVKSRGAVEGDFALCISLYHGFELLLQHGLRSLYNFLQSTVDGAKGFSRTRQELMRNMEFVQLMDALREKFGGAEEAEGFANRSHLFSSPGTPKVREVKPYITSHPKMAKLQEIVLEHFRKFAADKESPSLIKPSTSKQPPPTAHSTRVMIFAQYRDSVNEIAEMLNRHRPLLRCMGFVGQASAGKSSKGISQKEQLRVVKEFREGGYNTLVCTCVGEEGLDIGDVDLIVCYDAHKSPIRLVQRMGRTGRKRQGRIVMLVTEGKEAAVYDRSQYSKKGILKALQGNTRSLQLYPNSPRMVPRGLNPTPHKMFISVGEFMNKKDAKRKTSTARGRSSGAGIDTMLVKAKSSKKSGEFLSPEELAYWSANYKLDAAESQSLPSVPDRGRFVTLKNKKNKQTPKRSNRPEMSLTEWSPWQMTRQPVQFVEHSLRCRHFIELMEFIDLQNLTEGDDIYGQEMQMYLDEGDINRPKQKGIEKFCTRIRRDSVDDCNVSKLPGRNESKASSSLHVPVPEFEGGSGAKDLPRKRAKRNARPMELMSSPSDGNRSDEHLPDVFQEEDDNQEVPNYRKTPPSAQKNDARLNSGNTNGKSAEEEASKPSKPRKHKQKTKHLKPVLDSSDDDDFANESQLRKPPVNKSADSPKNGEDSHKLTAPKDNSASNKIDETPNEKTAYGEYESPEPMDTGSDSSVNLNFNKISEPIPTNNSPGSPRIDDDLSFLFPTQSVSLPPPKSKPPKKDKQDVSETRPKAGKSVIPPPPPSLSSLDLLDDIDSTFNLTQHFQRDSNCFGSLKDLNDQPSKSTSGKDLFKDENISELHMSPFSKFSKSNTQSPSEKQLPDALISTDQAVSNMESNDFPNLSVPLPKEIQENQNNNNHNKDNEPATPTVAEAHFDLNVDFTVISSSEDEDEQVEESRADRSQPTTEMSKKPSDEDNHDDKLYEDCSDFCPRDFENMVGTPQAFDVQTPQVGTTLIESNSNRIQKSLLTASVSTHSGEIDASLEKPVANRKSFQTRDPKVSSLAMPETPKSGLDSGAKSRFAGRLRVGSKRLSCTESPAITSRRELDLDQQEPTKLGTSVMQNDQKENQQSEDPAEIERLRMEVLGSSEPKFDLCFDLDSLDEDEQEGDKDILPPSPNVEQQQDYIIQRQVTVSNGQFDSRGTANVWTIASSTPVSQAESPQGAVSCRDFLSPIAMDNLDREQNTVINANPQMLSVDQSKISSTAKIRNSSETLKSEKHVLKSLSSNSLKEHETLKIGQFSTTHHTEPVISKDAVPSRKLSTASLSLGSKKCSSSQRSTIAGKRKSSPIANVSNDIPVSVKRQKSVPAGATTQNSNSLFKAVAGEFCAKEAGVIEVNRDGRTSPEVIVLDDDEDKDVQAVSEGRKAQDSSKHDTVCSDEEDDALSQAVQYKKRRKALALKSPETPAFKTPVKPSVGSFKKKRPVKPLVTSSEDEQESPLIRRPKKRRQIITMTDVDEGDDDFVDGNSAKKDASKVVRSSPDVAKVQQVNRKQKKTKRAKFPSGDARGFLEEEVVVSDSDECSSDEEGSDLDNSLEDFIDNASQLTQASQSALTGDDMHAVYMQSVRSPMEGGVLHPSRNRFKMVRQDNSHSPEIFSQAPLQDDTYYENSFVVREGEEEGENEVWEVGDGRPEKGSRRDQFEESLFENTINPDNIITSRRRGGNQGMSRAERILKEGRQKVLKSSSSASTSNEETDEESIRRDKKMLSSNTMRVRKASNQDDPIPNVNVTSTGWLSAVKTDKQKSVSEERSARKLVMNWQGSSVEGTNVKLLSKISEKGCPIDEGNRPNAGNKSCNQTDSLQNQSSQGSVIKQFLLGNGRQTNSCPDDFPNQKQEFHPSRLVNSNKEAGKVTNNGLTLAEKEKAERLRRQQEKKREFMLKMEERKRQQQQLEAKQTQEKLQQQQHQQQQQQFKQSSDQPQYHQFQELNLHQQLMQQKDEQYCGRSSHSARQNAKEVQLKTKQPLTSSSIGSLHKAEISTSVTASARNPPTQKPPRMSDLQDYPQGNQAPAMQGTKRMGSPGETQPRGLPVSPKSVQIMSKPTLAGSQEALSRGKPVILIDAKELASSSHIVSTLALRHNLNPIVCQLSGCDYIVSARMGVEKKSLSDFGSGANKNKLIDRVRHLCELFDRPCLILERDRVKPGDDKRPKQLNRTKYFDSTLAALNKTHIKVLYSDSLEDTARILADLVHIEARKGEGLAPPPSLDPTQEQALKLYLSLPRVSYSTALSLLTAFPCVQQLINSSPEDLKQRAKISLQRSAEILIFLGHQFDEQMTRLSSSR